MISSLQCQINKLLGLPLLKEEPKELKVETNTVEEIPSNNENAGQESNFEAILELQLRSKKSVKNNHQKCPECSKTFSTKANQERHYKIVHLKMLLEKCDKCGEEFGDKRELNDHVRSKHLGLFYACDTCDQKFTHKYTLQDHIKYKHILGTSRKPKTSPKNLKCPDCGRISTDVRNFKRHYKMVHLKERFNCEQCEDKFADRRNLRDHVRFKHEGLHYSCDHCDKEFGLELSLKTHIKNKHGQNDSECEIRQEKSEKSAKKLKNPKVTNTKCLECGKSFSIKRNLERHIDSVHKKIRFNCERCGKKYADPRALTDHVRSEHLGITYPCDECDKRFSFRTLLYKHFNDNHRK